MPLQVTEGPTCAGSRTQRCSKVSGHLGTSTMAVECWGLCGSLALKSGCIAVLIIDLSMKATAALPASLPFRTPGAPLQAWDSTRTSCKTGALRAVDKRSGRTLREVSPRYPAHCFDCRPWCVAVELTAHSVGCVESCWRSFQPHLYTWF
jgi:hypothetical protein